MWGVHLNTFIKQIQEPFSVFPHFMKFFVVYMSSQNILPYARHPLFACNSSYMAVIARILVLADFHNCWENMSLGFIERPYLKEKWVMEATDCPLKCSHMCTGSCSTPSHKHKYINIVCKVKENLSGFILNCIYFYIRVCVLAHIHTTSLPYPQKLEKHTGIPGIRITGRCELLCVGAET